MSATLRWGDFEDGTVKALRRPFFGTAGPRSEVRNAAWRPVFGSMLRIGVLFRLVGLELDGTG